MSKGNTFSLKLCFYSTKQYTNFKFYINCVQRILFVLFRTLKWLLWFWEQMPFYGLLPEPFQSICSYEMFSLFSTAENVLSVSLWDTVYYTFVTQQLLSEHSFHIKYYVLCTTELKEKVEVVVELNEVVVDKTIAYICGTCGIRAQGLWRGCTSKQGTSQYPIVWLFLNNVKHNSNFVYLIFQIKR